MVEILKIVHLLNIYNYNKAGLKMIGLINT